MAANVPYVPTSEIAFLPPEARAHEPRVALDGGPDGLDVLRRVAAGAPDWLAPGGHLLIETSERQASLAAAAFKAKRRVWITANNKAEGSAPLSLLKLAEEIAKLLD